MDIDQGTLALLIVALLPVLDRGKVRALRLGLPGSTRTALYRRGVLTLWLAATAVFIMGEEGWRYVTATPPAAEAWVNDHRLPAITAVLATGAFFIVAIGQGLACAGNAGRRRAIAPAFARLRFMLPVTRRERYWWILLSVSAGVCEELLYRGFLLHGLLGEGFFGIRPDVLPALLLGALAFGLGHLYQGWRGMLTSTVMGLAFGMLALGTGSLFLPVVLHAIIDLQILWMYRPDLDGAPDIAGADDAENFFA